MVAASHSLPEQGQIVSVRLRQWVVTEVTATTLPPSPLVQNTLASSQHLVALSSIEDDALGETLEVIWEIEPHARIDEKVGLPAFDGFDTPARFDAFLNAVRWGAISAADYRTLQAPFRSSIEIEDYQLDPLVRAVQMPRVSLLIADDVGMGKTIEAGLVAQELITRHRARTVLIVCPAALQVQWHDQMRDKFGLEFRIVDAQLMKELRRSRGIHVNPWTHFPRLITSIDFLKRDRPLRLLREILPAEGQVQYPRPFDILIVDEAHNIAPTGRAKYATDSQRTRAIRMLTPHFEHKLFISATPHNGYTASFTALLELLDDQRFARGVEPDRAQLGAVMVRRMKSELKQTWDGKPRFPARHVRAMPVSYTDEEKQVHAWLKAYARSRQERVAVTQDAERYATEFVLKLLKKRVFSSPAAFHLTLKKHLETLNKKARASLLKPTRASLEQSFARMDEEYADDNEYEESLDQAATVSAQLLSEVTASERALLNKMREWTEHNQARADSKARTLLEWLRGIVKPNGGWTDERVIVFTEYRATQNWLFGLLAAEGLAGNERVMMLYGGMETDKREHIKAAFQADPSKNNVRILLATDAASEGIDLQNYCHRLAHYEIP